MRAGHITYVLHMWMSISDANMQKLKITSSSEPKNLKIMNSVLTWKSKNNEYRGKNPPSVSNDLESIWLWTSCSYSPFDVLFLTPFAFDELLVADLPLFGCRGQLLSRMTAWFRLNFQHTSKTWHAYKQNFVETPRIAPKPYRFLTVLSL